MGKRELFIAIAFIVAGAAAYQLTTPPRTAGREGFSFSRFLDNAKRGIRGNAAQASYTTSGTIRVAPDLAEVRVEGLNRAVRFVGEARTDIAYELATESSGPDKAAALDYARQVLVKTDDLGSALTIRVIYPRGGRQFASMTLRLPSRLGVLVSTSNGLDVSNLASAHLDNVGGEVTLSRITGAVTGLHRNGSLVAREAGSTKLTLQRSRASFENIEHGLTLDVRDGECRIANSKGPIELDQTRADITVVNHGGAIRISGTEGRVTIADPHEVVKVDVRRAEVEATLGRAVPLTLLTTDDTLRVLLDGPPPVSIDVVANLGKIRAEDFHVQPDTIDQESRLTHTFGGGGVRVSLRNLRGDIVIRNTHGSIVNPRSK